MCFTKRTNKKVEKLIKLRNNKVYPEPTSSCKTYPASPKFDVVLEESEQKPAEETKETKDTQNIL